MGGLDRYVGVGVTNDHLGVGVYIWSTVVLLSFHTQILVSAYIPLWTPRCCSRILR